MNVEIWSDVVCPFCYIGKRHFELALAQFPHRDQVEVVWHSFQLDANAPIDYPGSIHDMLAAKYGMSQTEAKRLNDQVSARAAAVGITYDLDHAHPTNTFDAHRLAHLATAHDLQDAAEERLFAAYFTEGQHIGHHETLTALGTEIGLDNREVATMLAGDAYRDEVRRDFAEGRALGVTGVPFFVFDRRYAVSGAQPVDVFTGVLQQVWDESHPRPLVLVGANGTESEACDDGACAVPSGTGT